MTDEQQAEAEKDFHVFIENVKAHPQKSFTLRLEGGRGEYRGGELLINKPSGRGLSFTE